MPPARVTSVANAELARLYRRIGQRVYVEIVSGETASYGEVILATVSQQSASESGRDFTDTASPRLVIFFEASPDPEIVATLWRQSS
jgi:hypothetical protein